MTADPRDTVQPVPTAFAKPMGKANQIPLVEVAPGIFFSRIYWVYGPAPKGMPQTSEVNDPPCSGWSSCFVMHITDTTMRLFCPYSMQSWKVSKRSYESLSLAGHMPEVPNDSHRERLARKWKEYKRRGEAVDFFVAEEIMDALGVDIPSDEEIAKFRPAAAIPTPKSTKAKEAPKPAAKLLKPVKKDGRRGEVLAHFLQFDGNTGSIEEATAKFEITRSNLLSQFSLMRKNHGIDYVVDGDTATLQLPEGCDDPFE